MFFFFSSRRRHTRLQGDWSSDVCSSDLRLGDQVQIIPEAKVQSEVISYAPFILGEGGILLKIGIRGGSRGASAGEGLHERIRRNRGRSARGWTWVLWVLCSRSNHQRQAL